MVPSGTPNPAFTVNNDHSLWEQTTTGWQLLSPSNTISSVSAVTNGAGQADAFAIEHQGQTLWEYTPAGWSELSTGQFQQVSAAVNAAGQAVVYGVLNNHSLWEQNPANGTGLNVGWTQISPSNTIQSISRGHELRGARRCRIRRHAEPQPLGLWAWRLGGAVHRPVPADQRPASTGAGQSVVYTGVANDHSLWENNPAIAGSGWQILSPAKTIQAAAAAGPGQVFALTSNHNLWQYTASGWSSPTSNGSFNSLSGEETAKLGAGAWLFVTAWRRAAPCGSTERPGPRLPAATYRASPPPRHGRSRLSRPRSRVFRRRATAPRGRS